ncbi:MAG: hypothetical protein IIW92_12435 [Lachnospiraceae bacterium]|nr:hypothetical protein [Lachnospiraceae bacterium]MBQ5919361.1 hypothetical protein [Lachnospiraceae bacterium]
MKLVISEQELVTIIEEKYGIKGVKVELETTPVKSKKTTTPKEDVVEKPVENTVESSEEKELPEATPVEAPTSISNLFN